MHRVLVGLSVVLALGCLPRIPRQRLAEPAPVAVAWIVDPSYSGVAVEPPEALRTAVAAELKDHNLTLTTIPVEAIARQRLSDARFDVLKQSDEGRGAKVLVLIEQRVQFFSQIDGRYRWEVATTLSASLNGGPLARDPFEIPVILMFDHQKGPEAIEASSADVAQRLGILLDGVLAAETAR